MYYKYYNVVVDKKISYVFFLWCLKRIKVYDLLMEYENNNYIVFVLS